MNSDPNEEMKLLVKEERLELQEKLSDIDVKVYSNKLYPLLKINLLIILFFIDRGSHFTRSCHYVKCPQHVS